MSDEIKVVAYKGLNNTPALALAVRGWIELNDRGFGDRSMCVNACEDAFVAFFPNGLEMLPVGVMTYNYNEGARCLWINLSYVDEEFRGRGCYRALWDTIVAYAISIKAQSIQSGTHVRNNAMREVSKRLGRFEEFVILRFNLE